MSEAKPETVNEYTQWLKRELGVDLSEKLRNHHRAVTQQLSQDLEASPLWPALQAGIRDLNDRYFIQTGYPLVYGDFKPKIHTKPFTSSLDKSFRKNVVLNLNWPSPPREGWVLPNTWLEQLNDLVRTTFVVKYIDGVKFLADGICEICESLGQTCKIDMEAREEGYYAAHVYSIQTFSLFDSDLRSIRAAVSFEMQITTQLQEVIRRLLHRGYERRRSAPYRHSPIWQWEYESVDFRVNYLGHILHYLEGLIAETRKDLANGP